MVKDIQKKILLDDFNYIYKNLNNKNFFNNKSILLTGSEGFIGFYIKNFFINYFDVLGIKELTCVDNKIKKKIIKKNIIETNFDLINISLSKLKKNFNIIIHAASIASPVFYRKYPLQTCDINVIGTRNILEYAKSNANVSVLFFSTSEIYGDPDLKNIPTKETYRGNVSCNGPRSCYDESKRYAETLCYIYAKYFKVSVKVARPFNHYGPGLNINDGRAPADFAKAVCNKKNLVLYSDGLAKRSFCYISDACIAYLNILQIKKYVTFNVGNDKEISIIELAKCYQALAKKEFNYSPKIIFKKNSDINYLIDSPNRRRPNLNLIKKKISYKPKISFETGVLKYLKYLKNEI